MKCLWCFAGLCELHAWTTVTVLWLSFFFPLNLLSWKWVYILINFVFESILPIFILHSLILVHAMLISQADLFQTVFVYQFVFESIIMGNIADYYEAKLKIRIHEKHLFRERYPTYFYMCKKQKVLVDIF